MILGSEIENIFSLSGMPVINFSEQVFGQRTRLSQIRRGGFSKVHDLKTLRQLSSAQKQATIKVIGSDRENLAESPYLLSSLELLKVIEKTGLAPGRFANRIDFHFTSINQTLSSDNGRTPSLNMIILIASIFPDELYESIDETRQQGIRSSINHFKERCDFSTLLSTLSKRTEQNKGVPSYKSSAYL